MVWIVGVACIEGLWNVHASWRWIVHVSGSHDSLRKGSELPSSLVHNKCVVCPMTTDDHGVSTGKQGGSVTNLCLPAVRMGLTL